MCSHDSPAKTPQPVTTEVPQAYPSVRPKLCSQCAHTCATTGHTHLHECALDTTMLGSPAPTQPRAVPAPLLRQL